MIMIIKEIELKLDMDPVTGCVFASVFMDLLCFGHFLVNHQRRGVLADVRRGRE